MAPSDDRTPVEAPCTERVANRPIVCHALDALASAGISEVAVVAPSDRLVRIRASIESDSGLHPAVSYIAQTSRSDFLGALVAATPFVGEDSVVVHLADGLIGDTPAFLSKFLAEETGGIRILVHRGNGNHAGLAPLPEGLLGITELHECRNRLAVAGVCVFGPNVLRLATTASEDGQRSFDLIAVAEWLARHGHEPHAGFVRSWHRYCGQSGDLLELNRLVLDQHDPEAQPLDTGNNRIEGRVTIHPTAELTSSIIVGPSIIGPGARISNSFVGPYTSIGAGAEIEGAEVERSIIAEGARIMHISGRIESSTVGRRATIFRDFALPRAIRLHVGAYAELGLN